MTLATVRPLSARQRQLAITAVVVLLHVAVLWAVATGMLRRTVEFAIPAVVMAEILGPAPAAAPTPAPQTQPKAPEPPRAARPVPAPVAVPAPAPSPTPAPVPAIQAAAGPAPSATQSTHAPSGATAPATGTAAAAAAAPSAPARVELPSSDADYLRNPKPPYPPLSKRMGEQGKVVVRVLIGTDGLPQKAEIRQSSGHDRLDQAALATALKWRYVPGKRGGVPEAMWFNVPIDFVLE